MVIVLQNKEIDYQSNQTEWLGYVLLLVGTPYSVARFYEDKIVWDSSDTNELKGHCLNKKTPCTNQTKCNKFGTS